MRGRFRPDEADDIISAVKLCPDALAVMMRDGAQAAASKYNRTVKHEESEGER